MAEVFTAKSRSRKMSLASVYVDALERVHITRKRDVTDVNPPASIWSTMLESAREVFIHREGISRPVFSTTRSKPNCLIFRVRAEIEVDEDGVARDSLFFDVKVRPEFDGISVEVDLSGGFLQIAAHHEVDECRSEIFEIMYQGMREQVVFNWFGKVSAVD
jgi:hypothetical protein